MNLSIIPWKLIGIIAAALTLIAALWAHLASDARTRDKFAALTAQAAIVLSATKQAADNPDLTWTDTAGQIVALGASNRALKDAIKANNETIAELARRAVRNRATAQERLRIAEKAEAQRKAAIRKLSDMTITPAERDDCMTMLRDSEDAADTVWKEAV